MRVGRTEGAVMKLVRSVGMETVVVATGDARTITSGDHGTAGTAGLRSGCVTVAF